MSDQQPLLELRGLEKHFDQSNSLASQIADKVLQREPEKVRAVDGIDLKLRPNEVQGVIGESGCGKTTLLMTLMGLHSPTGGELVFDGTPLSEFTSEDWKEFRRRVQIIFQDPFNSMDPKFTVRETLMEPLDVHDMDNKEERIREALEHAELNPPEQYLDRLPKQLSGGEKQRVSIARALVVDPDVILADEPVSMLDVSIRASVLNILRRLRRDEGLTLSIISHDLSLIRNVSDRTAVMYLGEFVEVGDTDRIVEDPKHPYTEALVDSVPVPDPTIERTPVDISGEPPSPRNPPSGCRFHTRCPAVIPPDEFEFADGRFRELMDLRQDLHAGSVRVDRARRQANDPEDPESVAAAIKERRFDGSFIDSDAEEIVDDALLALARGEEDIATEQLADAFTTPCELDEPELTELEDGRQVACHLYE